MASRSPNRRASEFVKDLATLDHLLNIHPNREAIFGTDSTWSLDLPAESRENMLAQLKPNQMRRASENVINSLQSMGYENINNESAIYNVDHHIQAPDQKQHVLMDRSPFMLDEQTTKTNIALAQKSLKALGDDQKVALVDEGVVVSKRNDIDSIVQALI